MTIIISQKCDRCEANRDLKVGYRGGRATIVEAAEEDGWRAVTEFKHLCFDCIQKIIDPPTSQEKHAL